MFHTFVALRYLKGKRKFLFSFSNLLSLLGIIIGVFSLLVVSSVMNGFDQDMRKRVIGNKTEIKVYSNDYQPFADYNEIEQQVNKHPFVKGSAPVCENELLLQNGDYITTSICFGIDFDKHKSITELFDKIVVGSPTAEDLEDNGIILGLEQSLDLHATVGEYVQISSPLGTEPSPFGLLPRSRKFKVVGIFISGLPEFDQIYSYISLANAQYLGRNEGKVNFLEVRTGNINKAEKYAARINKELPQGYNAEDWSSFEANLFNAIKMEKIVMFLVLALMLIIASFNMSGNFIRLVAEKKSEIGILKAMGASDRDVIKVFTRVGIIIGVAGTLTGLGLALAILLAQAKWHFITIPIPGFAMHWLPVQLRLTDFIGVPVITIIISIITTLYPARKTVHISPIKTIRDQ